MTIVSAVVCVLALICAVAATMGMTQPGRVFTAFESSDPIPGENPGLGTTWLAPGNVIVPGVGVLGAGELTST